MTYTIAIGLAILIIIFIGYLVVVEEKNNHKNGKVKNTKYLFSDSDLDRLHQASVIGQMMDDKIQHQRNELRHKLQSGETTLSEFIIRSA